VSRHEILDFASGVIELTAIATRDEPRCYGSDNQRAEDCSSFAVKGGASSASLRAVRGVVVCPVRGGQLGKAAPKSTLIKIITGVIHAC
jgi:hypothetical protein